MSYTHRKKLYHATCVQWTDSNTSEVIAILKDHAEVTPYGDSLMIRWNDPRSHKYHIDTLDKGVWMRIGENGEMKTMPDTEFKLKYEEVT